MESDLPPGSCNSTGHLSTIGYHTLPGRMHHSMSTPAGVDCAGGGSRTPPATPKKGGKMLAVRVQMLDDTISMFQIQSKAFGRVLFDQVCRQLNLLEADYFGLEYQDANGTRYWLDVEKAMCRQVGLSMLEPTLRFCVKFYTPDPARLEEEFTRYLFCLQVKRDLAQGTLHCNENTAALMASYIVQAECGDFVPEDYPDHTYLSGYKFFPGQDPESERRIMENHKKHIGQSPAEADLNLLETARRCELYGIKMHPAKDHEGVPLNLAVAHMGIAVFQQFTKINTFSWAKIRKISFKRKKFLIKLHPEGYGYYRDVVEFLFEGRNECKNFWKKCVENHGFFRCSSVPRIPRHRPRVISRGSSFRYSGKTQKQIVEFVRENYVKRQTFQRCGSFRASRSLRSSRATVAAPAAPLNASVSAHPLLPLPPGSDAISLEWDKQPHYQEAFLMTKGYTAAEAREMCRRDARPALPTTAYVATTRRAQGPELVTHAEVNHHPIQDSPLPHRTTTSQAGPAESTWTAIWQQQGAPGRTDETSPEEDATVSSASLCMSPVVADRGAAPLSSSTPLVINKTTSLHTGHVDTQTTNGYDAVDNCDKRRDSNSNTINGNVNVTVIESTSMDVLSGGESDAGDTLSRTNNNSISSNLKTGTFDTSKRRADITYFIAKELLMTERTYKRDLELVTVNWSGRVSNLASTDSDGVAASTLARGCLSLEPIALAQGALLARLERMFTSDSEEPEYRKIGELLQDHLTGTHEAYSAYIEHVGTLVALIESVRRSNKVAAHECSAFDNASPLPLACLLLRPLHRLLYYRNLINELSTSRSIIRDGDSQTERQLRHIENHAALCQLQRDIVGYDKLLIADREFVRLGCVYKHSQKGLQQRMLFLFNDILVVTSRGGAGQARAHAVLPLHALQLNAAHLPHSFTLTGEDINLLISTSNDNEYRGWYEALEYSIEQAKLNPKDIDEELTCSSHDTEDTGVAVAAGGGAAHVCWHRATSITRDALHMLYRTQLSGYLLRKFKNSHGWQKLWVVFAAFTLYFYKSWQDRAPLASLPLLGYTVSAPADSDGIHKEFVFKLQFKTHVYFFRADSAYTYNRWTEVLQTAMVNRRIDR